MPSDEHCGPKLDFPTRFNGVQAPWFPDPKLRAVFSGTAYAFRSVAAIGPADGSRVLLVATSNPRQRASKLGRERGEALIVHQAIWSRLRTADAVLSCAHDLLRQAGHADPAAFLPLPPPLLDALLMQAAERAGVPAMLHHEFHAHALGVETEKLRAGLLKAGIDPAVVAAYRCVTARRTSPNDSAALDPPKPPPPRRKAGFARTQAMARRYRDGATLREVAAEFGMSWTRAREILIGSACIELRPRGRQPNAPEKTFVKG